MKRIIIDMATRMEHHMLSGNSFYVDERLERRDGNVYLDRTYTRHPNISRSRSILIPSLHLWVMFWEGLTGPHPCRCYMHMAHIVDEGARVVVDDLYLDVTAMRDGRWQVLDIDEFRAAISSGELTPAQVQIALEGLEHACRLVEAGLTGMDDVHRYVSQRAGA